MLRTPAYAPIKLRALLLARRMREVDLVDLQKLKRAGLSAGFFVKYTNEVLHGKREVVADDPKIRLIAHRLGLHSTLFVDDTLWPTPGHRLGLSAEETQTLLSLKLLYDWYETHAGEEAAYRFLNQEFDFLRRQSQIVQGMARALGSEAVIRVFLGIDHEEGRFEREFQKLERIALRHRSLRRRILDYVADIPPSERLGGRSFQKLSLGTLQIELEFTRDLPRDREDVRYEGMTKGLVRRLRIREGMSDERLAFILARELAISQADREDVIDGTPYVRCHWPCPIVTYRKGKSEVMVNRLAAAILVPRTLIAARAGEILKNFSFDVVEEACRELRCPAETLLLRIVQIYPDISHFLRIDAPGPNGSFTLDKLYRGNGLPVQFEYSANPFPPEWGVIKALHRFFAHARKDPLEAHRLSRHVQLTRLQRCGALQYLCMTLVYPRFGGGYKALCIGFRYKDYQHLFGRASALTESGVVVDDRSYDMDWSRLMSLERESRRRQ